MTQSPVSEPGLSVPAPASRDPLIMLVTGEPSGDALGAQLMAALKELTGGRVRLIGVGGDAMAAEGLKSLFPISDTAVMGLREVFPAIPRILKRVRQTADYIERVRPDVLVLVDCPGFNHRIAKRLVKRAPEIKVVKYVAPQVWASRPHRAAQLAGFADCVLTLFPFEPPWFTKEGMAAAFVGNPVVERAALMTGGAAFRKVHDIAPGAPLLVMLPGSRANEIRFMMPIFRETLALLERRLPGLEVVLPMVPHMVEKISDASHDWPARLHLVDQSEKFAAFDAADVALAASGTVTTELALAKVPMVVAYRVGWVTAWFYRNLIKVPFITLVNILQKRGAVPEFLQEGARPNAIADELEILLTDPKAASAQVDEQQQALKQMGLGAESPSRRAAQAVLDMLHNEPSPVKLQRAGIAPSQLRRALSKAAPKRAAF